MRAIEGIAFSVPLLILLFASSYVGISAVDDHSFTEQVNRLDSMYFTVTVFMTVGFGDIAPKTDAARILVTIQMLADLALIGVIAKVLLGAVQQRRAALDSNASLGDVNADSSGANQVQLPRTSDSIASPDNA